MPPEEVKHEIVESPYRISWVRVGKFIIPLALIMLAAAYWFTFIYIPSKIEPPKETQLIPNTEATPSAKKATQSAKKDETVGWKTYTSKQGSYSIKYPVGWFIGLETTSDIPDSPGGGKMFILQLTSCDTSKNNQCTLKGKENFLQITAYDKYTEGLENFYQALNSGREIFDKETITLDDEIGIRYSRKLGGNYNLIYHEILVKHLDKIFHIYISINSNSSSGEQNQQIKIFDQILSTFKFL